MQADGLGGDIRKAMRVRTGGPTIPQIFIGGVHVIGAVDVLTRHDRGEFEPLLRKAGVAPTSDTTLVARSYLPQWLAARGAT
jgi:cysteine synthase